MGIVAVGPSLMRCTSDGQTPVPSGPHFPAYNPPSIQPPAKSNFSNIGELGDADADGVRLPAGFTVRIVARSGQLVEGTEYVWHGAPDGGATFLTEDGGWVYVSNSEVLIGGEDGLTGGGVGAIRFDAKGNIVDAYSILTGTKINCAGGPTPWGTWLSCEEAGDGRVWECDPFGQVEAVVWPQLGVFKHEAATIDTDHDIVYLTEDVETGRFYRFIPKNEMEGRLDFSEGTLQVLRVLDGIEGAVAWHDILDPLGNPIPTRQQVPESTVFDGGEGIWFHEGVVYFATKGDNRVWTYDSFSEELAILYDDDTSDNPILSGVDNVTVSAAGDVLVAEDAGDMQVVAITPAGELVALFQLLGQDTSEITGPALDPYRQRLYFSSQRGTTGELLGGGGLTYEITGPFFVA